MLPYMAYMDPMGYVSMGELSLSEGIQHLSQVKKIQSELLELTVIVTVIRNYKDQTYKLHNKLGLPTLVE